MSLLSALRRLFAPAPQPAAPEPPAAQPRLRSVQCIGPHGLHRMAYAEWGDPRNPRVLACVHGLTRNGRDFDDFARAMSGHYRIVCPDVAGRGRSDWLGVKEDYGFPLYIADMVTLIARLDADEVHWVGTSMGGLIGMMLAGLPHSPVTRLVLNDIGPAITAAALRRIGEYVGNAPEFAAMEAVEAYLREVNASFGPLTAAQWRHLARYSAGPAEGGFAMLYDPGIGDVFRQTPLIADIDLWQVYDRIACPVLAVRGAQSDLLEPAVLRAMTERGPRARAVEFAGVGHAPMLMDEAQIAAVRAFLLEP